MTSRSSVCKCSLSTVYELRSFASTQLTVDFGLHPFDLGGVTDQTRALFALFPDLNRDYLERRVRYESVVDHGPEILAP